jgi:hypothetical protein
MMVRNLIGPAMWLPRIGLYPPISGGDRKALAKELAKSRAMTKIFAGRSEEKRCIDEALIREADNLACQSWNEKMWSDGGPIHR